MAAAVHMACSYLTVCSNGLLPTKLLVDALRFLQKSGHLMLGVCLTGAEEAHLSGVGNTIRMVMSHFIELKRCAVTKEIAFRKVRL